MAATTPTATTATSTPATPAPAPAPAAAATQKKPVPKALMDISVMHPSKYLSAADLNGRTITVKIASISEELVQMSDGGEESKVIIRFEKARKDFIGGPTNDYSIAVLLSRRPIDWIGKRVTLMPSQTTFGRAVKQCIRIAGSPDAPPERAKAFDQARARTAQVEFKKQAKRFVSELKATLDEIDPIKITETVAVPALDPQPADEAVGKGATKQTDAFGLDGGNE